MCGHGTFRSVPPPLGELTGTISKSVEEVFNVVTEQIFTVDADIELVQYQVLKRLLDVRLTDQHGSNHPTST